MKIINNIKLGFATNSSSYHSALVLETEVYEKLWGKDLWVEINGIRINRFIFLELGGLPKDQKEADETWQDLIDEFLEYNDKEVTDEKMIDYLEVDRGTVKDIELLHYTTKSGDKITALSVYHSDN